MLNLLNFILLEDGHYVKTATDGIQGIEAFEKNEFDLVFTDLGMPGMSGWQVAKKIKAIDPKVPIVLFTGWDIKLKESELRESGIDLVIQKPFEIAQLLSLIQEGMLLIKKFTVS